RIPFVPRMLRIRGESGDVERVDGEHLAGAHDRADVVGRTQVVRDDHDAPLIRGLPTEFTVSTEITVPGEFTVPGDATQAGDIVLIGGSDLYITAHDAGTLAGHRRHPAHLSRPQPDGHGVTTARPRSVPSCSR